MSTTSESKKQVLGGLANGADALTKKVINTYNPSALYKVNLAKMMVHSAAYLEACAQYLGFVVREDGKKLYQKKEILCDRMILKIESLFDIHCDECDSSYRNELTDEPLLRCQLCLQGSHSCDGMKEKANVFKDLEDKNLLPPGATWICHAFNMKNNLSLLPTKPNTTTSSNLELSAIDETPEEEDEEAQPEEEEEDGDRISPRRNRSDSAGPGSQLTGNPENICRDYILRKCKHGLTGKRLIDGRKCAFNHPPRCRRYCSYGEDKRLGCRRGKECKYYHPKLCRQSEISRSCMNRECGFTHLKGTKRPPTENSRTRDDNTAHVAERAPNYRDPWNNPGRFPRVGSMASLNTPYPPTVDHDPTTRRQRQRNNSLSDRDSTFLEKLLENLKVGIITQMDSKISELKDQIPSMVQDTIMVNQSAPRSRQPSGQSVLLQGQPSYPHTLPQQMTFPQQMTLPQVQYPIPSYQGLSF